MANSIIPSSPTLAETRKRCPSIKCRWESTASAGCCDGSLKSQMIPPSTSATSCFCPPSINTSVPTWHLTPGGRWKPVRCARWETTWCRSTTGRSMSSTWRKTTQLGLSSGMIIDNRYCLQLFIKENCIVNTSLFISRNGTWNLLNRYAISQGPFMF